MSREFQAICKHLTLLKDYHKTWQQPESTFKDSDLMNWHFIVRYTYVWFERKKDFLYYNNMFQSRELNLKHLKMCHWFLLSVRAVFSRTLNVFGSGALYTKIKRIWMILKANMKNISLNGFIPFIWYLNVKFYLLKKRC